MSYADTEALKCYYATRQMLLSMTCLSKRRFFHESMLPDNPYRVGQIKRGQLIFLLVTSERIL